jgi:hypothetical protein
MVWDVLFWAGVAVAILVAIFAIIMVIGVFLPRYHRVRREIDIQQTEDVVWRTITDYASIPSWHKEVVKVERLDERNGHEVWRETYLGNYPITLETTVAEAPHRLVRYIADERGPFTGRWEFDVTSTAAGCHVAITEFGDIANPFFRFMARLFMNPATYLEMYLIALAARFGEEAKF